LSNLTFLYCSYSNITEIPLLPNLTTLDCSSTNITEISLFPNLTYLVCWNTKITELPNIPNCKIQYHHCLWLKKWYEKFGNLKDFIFLEDKIKFSEKEME